MRSYHVAAASFAIECDTKWLDNVITQCSPAGVTRANRGVARRISADAVLTIAIARSLSADLGIPMPRAIEIGKALIDGGGRVVCRSGAVLTVDIEPMRAAIGRRLADAAEVLVPPRRGRPPRNAQREELG